MTWVAAGQTGQTLYRGMDLVGIMTTTEIAEHVSYAMNLVEGQEAIAAESDERTLEGDIMHALNYHSADSKLGVPDWLLAEILMATLGGLAAALEAHRKSIRTFGIDHYQDLDEEEEGTLGWSSSSTPGSAS